MRFRLPLLALGLLLAWARPTPAQEFFFKDGDVVVVMGDSITEQRLYSNYLEMWTVSRFPAWKLTFRNVGIGGDRSTGGNGRFKRDVLAFKPTALTVDFGMNDGNYQPFGEPAFQVYMKGLQGIADQANAAKIRVAWVTPQPTERGEPGPQLAGYNQTLEKYSEGVGEIAKKNDGLFCDQFHPYLAVIDKARESDPKIKITGGDAVHPGPPGQALMAASILKAMHFPRAVSSVSIDVAGQNPTDVLTKNCKVSDVNTKDGVRFKRLDQALPYFPEDARSILKWAPLLDEMNHYGLQVKGLKAGKYEVLLGGKKAAVYTADELAKGVNLAEAALTVGPVSEQVKAVWKAVQAKTDYFHGQIFRGVMLAPGTPLFTPQELEKRRQELYDERMARMPELDDAIRATLTMRPYEVEIVPAKE
jgi:lysophospholipase L1-like esterase